MALTVPALGVLAAEPLYVLVDTAVVGHLGKLALAALAVGAVVLAQVSTQLTFLSYGTTTRTAHLFGAGRRSEAVAEGVQATYLAIVVGVVLLLLGEATAGPVTRLIAGSTAVAGLAESWLRVAVLGIPFILVILAGNGWMRGVQDTRRPLWYVIAGNGLSAVLLPLFVFGFGWGITGSAVANVLAQMVTAALFAAGLIAERVSLRPRPAVMRAQLGLGRDLVIRSLAFQACFVSATLVAAHMSAAVVAAHQILFQLWTFLQLVLDSLAIAAQALVGAALGKRQAPRARRIGWRITRYGLGLGLFSGLLLAALSSVLPRLFTPNAEVLGQVDHAWWFLVVLQPAAGVVFALDGVLIGAGDIVYLRAITIAAAALGFLPLIWISLVLGWGLIGIWVGLAVFIVIRLVALLVRARSPRWTAIPVTAATG